MILRQFLHTSPAVAASYMFGYGSKQAGCVVDPVAEPSFYLDAAAVLGTQIRYVIDTHIHADHVSTGRSLALAVGGAYVLHETVDASFPFQRVRDGDQVDLGNTVAAIMHLPGHSSAQALLGYCKTSIRRFDPTGASNVTSALSHPIPRVAPAEEYVLDYQQRDDTRQQCSR